ncbi:hypothetical protein MED222_06475 [Vibrio sp. MED222]|nr:hypothetical protein MED222_06475 [Vibrio sp. MED222]
MIWANDITFTIGNTNQSLYAYLSQRRIKYRLVDTCKC